LFFVFLVLFIMSFFSILNGILLFFREKIWVTQAKITVLLDVVSKKNKSFVFNYFLKSKPAAMRSAVSFILAGLALGSWALYFLLENIAFVFLGTGLFFVWIFVVLYLESKDKYFIKKVKPKLPGRQPG